MEKTKQTMIGVGLAVIFFLLIIILGLSIYSDYGISVDEYIERDTGLITLKYFLTTVLGKTDLPEQLKNMPDLLTYEDKDYGMVLQMPLVLIEYFSNFSLDMRTVLKIRHLWVYFNFILALIFFYMLIYKRYSNWIIAQISVIFLFFSPRIFADSFYNIKDSLFLSWFIIGIFFYFLFLSNPSIKNSILVSIVGALVTNIRIIGGILPLFACLYCFYLLSQKRMAGKECLSRLIVIGSISLFLYALFLPASWANPFLFLKEALNHFSNYDHFEYALYLGNFEPSDNLPWHYLFVWIGVTTPVLYVALFLLGLVIILFLKKKTEPSIFFFDTSMIALFFIPILAAIILNSTIYNGWRHFYFLYAPFLIVAISALNFLLFSPRKIVSILTIILCTGSVFMTMIWMNKNHPFQMVYFNQLVRTRVDELFIRDYWNMSFKSGLDYILQNDDRQSINIGYKNGGFRWAEFYLPKSQRDRIRKSPVDVGTNEIDYIFYNYRDIKGNDKHFAFFQPIHDFSVDSYKIATIYERDHGDELQSWQVIDDISVEKNETDGHLIYDGDLSTGWVIDMNSAGFESIEITLSSDFILNGISISSDREMKGYPRNLEIKVSTDSITWDNVEFTYQTYSDFEFLPVAAKYIRLVNSPNSPDEIWAMNEITFHGYLLDR